MACGTEDFLIEENHRFRDFLRAEGVPTAIRENNIAALRQIMDSYRQQGMRTLDFSLRELLATGKITASEAYARATDKRQFQHFLVGY